jgi:hypothetical protein
MKLSVVVIAFNIPRELPRTLWTLSGAYQRDMATEDYEVLVVDNGSTPPVNPLDFADLKGNFRFLRIDDARPSPAQAINKGLAAATGDVVGVMIDGARMVSPGMLSYALQGASLGADHVVGALGWYLGFDFQRNAMQFGYNQAAEDKLLDSVDWRGDGYALFDISTLDESSMDGWFSPIAELNVIFLHKQKWAQLGGFNEQFDLPGGGLVNLDLYARAIEDPDAHLVLLIGEASFHQFHHGVATNSSAEKALDDWALWAAQYAQILGKPYAVPTPQHSPVLLGSVPPAMRRQFARASFLPAPDRQTGQVAEGTGNPLEDLLLGTSAVATSRPVPLARALQLVRQQIRLNRFATAAALCREIRRYYPEFRPALELLSLIPAWVPHADRYSVAQKLDVRPATQEVQKILSGSNIGLHPGTAPNRSDSVEANPSPTASAVGTAETQLEHIERRLPAQLEAAFMEPLHMSFSAPWAGHIPFAAWLVAVQRPAMFVELGSFIGVSYLAFCQAIQAQNVACHAYAVDTWEGDAHTGPYGEDVFSIIRRNHDPLYTGFSSLLRMTFDEALPQFEPASIDLLHIDGLHTYEAVRHDFETWLPKMSLRGVILFHDTEVRHGDFGVYRFWAEVRVRYPSFDFAHSNGLGVLLVGKDQPADLMALAVEFSRAETSPARQAFSQLGARLERLAETLALHQRLKDAQELNADLIKGGQTRHDWIVKLDAEQLELRQTGANLERALREHQGLLADADALLLQRNAQLARLLNSRSWKLTAPLRWAIMNARRLRNGLSYVRNGQWGALKERIKSHLRDRSPTNSIDEGPSASKRIGILTPPHTLFVAHGITKELERAGFETVIMTEPPPDGFKLGMYVVLCPQIFAKLPPGERRIAFQMEQAVSERWFTKDYLNILESSSSVLDYARFNLRYLEGKGVRYPHTYWVPVGAIADYPEFLQARGLLGADTGKGCDVLFYGDVTAPRRQRLLKAIGGQFNLRVERDLFGPALYVAVRSARVVVNIHYYEGALLESTRLLECLSLGATVVSETGVDQDEYAALESIIHFCPVDDQQALLNAIGRALATPVDAEHLQAVVQRSDEQFSFMWNRAMLGTHLIGPGQFGNLTASYKLPCDRLVLSLPETLHRRSLFDHVRPHGVDTFDGLRRRPGWVGCALSYQYLAKKALEQGFERLDVMEDDVLLPADYAQRCAVIDRYLAARSGEWDIFAGLITVLHPDAQVLNVEEVEGLTFITLDRMTSMVHNRYAVSALKKLAQWDVTNPDAATNTIDKYLESQANLRVVITLPHLVGHREDAHSSLWGFSNTQYSEIIGNSERQIKALVDAYVATAN